MPIYEASISFITNVLEPNSLTPIRGEKAEQSLSPIFESIDRVEAVRDALRWGRNRLDALKPLGFEEICCIKVREFPIGRVQEDGILLTGGQFHFFEWKFDWGVSIDEAIQALETQEDSR